MIQLARAAGPRNDPRLAWLYVGQTGKSIAERFSDHVTGWKSSRLVKEHGRHLRPDLYDDLSPVAGEYDALRLEADRARELAALGYVAHTDGTSHSQQPPYQEWDRSRVDPIVDNHLDPAIFQVVAAVEAPLSADICAHILYGTESAEVKQRIDGPIPAYGHFAHVKFSVLSQRIGELVGAGVLTCSESGHVGFPIQPDA